MMENKVHTRVFVFLLNAVLLLSPFSTININAADANVVDIKVDTTSGRKLISPYIYGINDTADLTGLTVRSIKQGGNNFTTYNWENNYSNSGADWFNTSDNSLVSEFTLAQQKEPALVIEGLINKASAYNIPFTVTTLPMSGYVAADGNGPILNDQTAPSGRWISIQNKKNNPFSLTPDLTDNFVYIDEYVNYILNKYGKSTDSTSIKAYALDNEPDLWSSEHSTINSTAITADELLKKSIDLATVIKGLDERAMVLGGQFSGMKAYISLNNAADWEALKKDYNWFIDYYLAKMKEAGVNSGIHLMDVLDLHYYSANSADGILTAVDCEDYANIECNKARMQSARTLWDSTYIENSWIGQSCQQYLPLIPTIQASINKYYSGTKLAFSEYNFGGGGDISGAIAEIDALGIFAKEGVFLACLNPNEGDISYQKAAINLFTNYDGNGSSFGNTIVQAETTDNQYSSVYASIDNADENILKIILTNKNYDSKITSRIKINSSVDYKGGAAYGFNSKASNILKLYDLKNITDNSFSYELEPRSAVELILTTNGSEPEITTTDYSNEISEGSSNSENTSATTISTNIIESDSTTNSTDSSKIQTTTKELSNSTEISTTSSDYVIPAISHHQAPFFIKFLVILTILTTICGIVYLFISDIFVKK